MFCSPDLFAAVLADAAALFVVGAVQIQVVCWGLEATVAEPLARFGPVLLLPFSRREKVARRDG